MPSETGNAKGKYVTTAIVFEQENGKAKEQLGGRKHEIYMEQFDGKDGGARH